MDISMFDRLADKIKNHPELIQLVNDIIEIMDFAYKPEMLELKNKDKLTYERCVKDLKPEFSDKYYSLTMLILDMNGENTKFQHLISMIELKCDMLAGNISEAVACERIREELSEHYIYPKFGGKQQFEKTILDRHKKNKHSKGRHIKK